VNSRSDALLFGVLSRLAESAACDAERDGAGDEKPSGASVGRSREGRSGYSASRAAAVFSRRKGADRDCRLRGEDSIAELCRKEGINQNIYRWSKEFLEAGKKRLAGDTAREATSDEVKGLRTEAQQLKELLAEVLLENRLLKKSVLGGGESDT
jgi:transposase-like protein